MSNASPTLHSSSWSSSAAGLLTRDHHLTVPLDRSGQGDSATDGTESITVYAREISVAGIDPLLLDAHLLHAALWLVVALLGLAGCYLVLGAELVALVQVLVYVGAVVVLVLFAVMLTRAPIGRSGDHDAPIMTRMAALVIAAAIDTFPSAASIERAEDGWETLGDDLEALPRGEHVEQRRVGRLDRDGAVVDPERLGEELGVRDGVVRR